MNISNVYGGYNVYNNISQNSIQKTNEKRATETSKVDTLTISNEAKNLMEKETLPLEAYSLPKWMEDYTIPQSHISSADVNHEFFDYAKALRENSNISNEKRQKLIKNYTENDPIHQKLLDNYEFQSNNRGSISEYSKLLHKYLNEARKDNGINSTKDNYEKVILTNNKALDEKIHQSFLKYINNDPKFLELMNDLKKI